MQTSRKTTLSRSWPTWCGEVADLRRLASIVSSLGAARCKAVISDDLAEDEWRLARWREFDPDAVVTIVDGPDTASGAADNLFEEIDRRTIQKVIIRAEFPGTDERMEIRFDKDRAFYGGAVELEVSSVTPGWARQCLAQLSDEIEKSVPRWAWFWTQAGMTFSTLIVGVILVGIPLIIEDRYISNKSSLKVAVPLTIACAFAIFAWVPMYSGRVWRWLFPRFEVIGEGGSSTGGRRFAALLTFALTTLAGLLIGIL